VTPLLKGVQVDLNDLERTVHLFFEEATRTLGYPDTAANKMKRFEFAKVHYSWTESADHYARIIRKFMPISNDQVLPDRQIDRTPMRQVGSAF